MNLYNNIQNIDLARLNSCEHKMMIDYNECSLEIEFNADVIAKKGFSNYIDISETDDHDSIEIFNLKLSPTSKIYTHSGHSILLLNAQMIKDLKGIIENEIINSDVQKFLA